MYLGTLVNPWEGNDSHQLQFPVKCKGGSHWNWKGLVELYRQSNSYMNWSEIIEIYENIMAGEFF